MYDLLGAHWSVVSVSKDVENVLSGPSPSEHGNALNKVLLLEE